MAMDQYLEMFVSESKEHVQAMNDNLLKLENAPDDVSIVNEIFRSAHTLKGMAGTMGYTDLMTLTHQLENVLDELRNGKIHFSSDLLDLIFEAMDNIETMVDSIALGGDGKQDVTEIIEKLKTISGGKSVTLDSTSNGNELSNGQFNYDEYELSVLEESLSQGYNVYEILVELRSDCMLKGVRAFMVFDTLSKTGEIVKSTPAVDQLEEENFDQSFTVTYLTKLSMDEVKKAILAISEIDKVTLSELTIENLRNRNSNVVQASKKEERSTEHGDASRNLGLQRTKSIRVNIEKLDSLINLFEELIIDRGRLEEITKEINHPVLKETVEKISRVSSDLQSIVLNLRMVPVSTVFNRFPKMVRQLARNLQKKIQLVISGEETELDRTVIDQIGDPLVHLLRNSIDHGIEMPEERLTKGKPEEGTILLKAYHSGNHVFIEISDDGGGINIEKVLNKAIKNGLVDEKTAKNLSNEEIIEFIFSPGFSTSEQVSDLSGRGVGLDAVKNKIEQLGGTISVKTEKGQGSRFIIQLPLTLSIIAVMLVEIGKEKYAIPLTSIVENIIFNKKDIQYAHNQPVLHFRDRVVPLLYLDKIFQVKDVEETDELSAVIIQKGDKWAGFVVSSFLGQQEVVLKSLGEYLKNVFAISGATILGNGEVALVIDPNALLK